MGKLFALLIVAFLFVFIVYNVYFYFIEPHLFDDEVEEIIEDATHNRVLKEAHKVADKIENEKLEETDVESQV